MRSATHDERAALAVTTAAIVGDEAAAKQHNCSERSIQRWRAKMPSDAELAAAVHRARARVLDRGWVGSLGTAIEAAIGFLERSAAEADPSDPQSILAVSRALRTLGEVAAWHEATDDVRAGTVREAPSGPGGDIQSGSA